MGKNPSHTVEHGSSAHLIEYTNEERYRHLLDSAEDAIYMLDPAGHVVTWNLGAVHKIGYSAEEVLGRHYSMFYLPEDIASDVPGKELEEVLATGRCVRDGWRQCKNGERFWVNSVCTAMRAADGTLLGFARVSRDLTERKLMGDSILAMQESLRKEHDALQAAAESSMDAFYICQALRNPAGKIEDFIFTFLNSNVEKMVTMTRSALLGGRLCVHFPINLANGLFEQYKAVVETGIPFAREFPVDAENVKSAWLRVQAVKLQDGVAITASDITKRKRHESQMLYLAQHDHLTGLPSRSLLNDRTGQAIEKARRSGQKVALFLIDLDAFKQINDTLGHSAGDAVLISVGARLKAAVRSSDSVIRIGGDEFVVVMPDITRQTSVAECGRKILNSLREGIQLPERTLHVTCSIGAAIYPDTADTVQSMINQADESMYLAKRCGKNQLEIFSSALSPHLDENSLARYSTSARVGFPTASRTA